MGAVSLCYGLSAFAQQTEITASSIKIGSNVIQNGTVCAVAVDNTDNPISVAVAGGGLMGVGQSCAPIVNGAITALTDAEPYTLPDSALAGNAGFLYDFLVMDTNSKQSFSVKKVAGVQGSTWALDHYFAPISVPLADGMTFTTGSGAPTGACALRSLYEDISIADSPVLYSCGGDQQFHLLGGADGGTVDAAARATAATALSTATAAQGTANSAQSAATAALPKTGGTLSGPLVLAADPTVSTQAATKNYVDTHAGSGGGATTPATSTLLKGNGTANGVVAAVPGTDFATPSSVTAVSTVANAALPKAGGTLTGPVILAADPTASLQAATKNYVDTHAGSGTVPSGTPLRIASYDSAGHLTNVNGVTDSTGNSLSMASINGTLNSDIQGGVVATAASSGCVSGQCAMIIPGNSTDTYSGQLLNKQAIVIGTQGGKFSSYVENSNATAHQFSTTNNIRAFQGATDASTGGAITLGVSGIFSAPGSYDYGRESGNRLLNLSGVDTALGIEQAFSATYAAWGDGDKAHHYWYYYYGGGGHGNGDDEGSTAYASASLETGGSVPVSLVNSYDSTLHWLSLESQNAEGQIGAGRNAIITTNADDSDASVVTGCNIVAANNFPINGLPPSVTTDCTLPASTYIGQATAAILPPRNLASATPMTVTFNTVSGTAPAAGTMACLTSANAHEAVRVVSSSTAGSVVTMTVNVMQNFFLDRSNNGPYIMAGGLCETWGREASGILNANEVVAGPMSIVFNIPGVAADGHTLYYSIPETETYQVLSSLYAYSIPQVVIPGNVLLTRVGGIVTVNLHNTSVNISSLPLVISGSPSGSFDGSFTSQPGTCGSGGCGTWTQAGPDITTPVSATITIGGGNQQLSVYKGALIIDTSRPSIDGTVGDNNIQLADNDVAWPAGSMIEVPFGTMGAIYEKKFEQVYMPMTTGDYTFSQGTAISGSYARWSWDNNNPWTMYQNTGGTFTLPRAFHVGGPFGTLFDVSSNGANGAGGLAPQASIFNVQCAFPGRADSQGYLFSLAMNGTNGRIVDDCFNNEIDLNIVPTNLAWTPGLRIQQTGIQVDGTQYNSSGEIHLGMGAGGKLNPNGTSEHPGLYFKNYSTGNTNSLVGCEMFFGSPNQDLCMGNVQNSDSSIYTADGSLELGRLFANYSSELNNIYVGPHAPYQKPVVNSNTILSGQNGWEYSLTWTDGISESAVSFPVTFGSNNANGTVQAASTMNTTNHAVVTCPSSQNGYSGTGHYNLYSTPLFSVVASAPRDNTSVLLGTCNPGTTFSDDNTTTPIVKSPPDETQGGTTWAGLYKANNLGGFGWYPTNQTTSTMDTMFSRIAANTVTLGNGIQGDFSGSLKLNHVIATDWNGKLVCLADGTNCSATTGTPGATGATGPAGTAATIAVGTVTTGAAGTSAIVTNAGTSSAAVFNFTIPRGAAGTGGGTGSGASPAGTNAVQASSSDGTTLTVATPAQIAAGLNDPTTNSAWGFQVGSGGDASCPTPFTGRDYFCFKGGQVQKSHNAGAYAPFMVLSCQPGLGDGLNVIPSGTYPQTTCRNESGATWTVSSIKCVTDTGTSTCNVTNGAGTALLTGAITGTSSYATGTQSSTTTIAPGDVLHITFVADGNTKQIGIDISGTY